MGDQTFAIELLELGAGEDGAPAEAVGTVSGVVAASRANCNPAPCFASEFAEGIVGIDCLPGWFDPRLRRRLQADTCRAE